MDTQLQVHLTPDERSELEQMVHSGTHSARTLTRVRILLLADRSHGEKRTDLFIADALQCNRTTVRTVRKRYVEGGLTLALYEKSRPGATPTFTGEDEAHLTMLACSQPPEGHARWTLRLLADRMIELGYVESISHVTVRELLEKNDLKPQQVKSWCIGKPSAQYVAKMEDVLDVYARPYDATRPLVCLDEVSKELHTTPHGTLALSPGRPERQDYEYARQGVCNLFLAVEPLTGQRTVRVTERRTLQDFAEELRILVEESYPDAERIVLVTDNLNTHTPACLYARFAPAQARRIAARLEWHYTPEHGSWLNVAECELSVLARQCLKRRIGSRSDLEQEVAAWQSRRNAAKVTVDWQFKTTDARIKLKRLYPVLTEQASP